MYRLIVSLLIFLCPLTTHVFLNAEEAQKIVYVYRTLVNGEDVRKWALEQGIATTLKPESMHITLAYSKQGLQKENIYPEKAYLINADENYVRTLELFGKEHSVLVLKIEEPAFSDRWQHFIDLGGSWDWPSYQPHIAITYDGKDLDLSQITPYHGVLIFGPEVIEEIDSRIPEKIEEVV